MDELTRFARRLVEQLSASKDGVHRAVSVEQVRQKLLPYRTHRKALQLDSVEDYETVLLRLVAGERGFVKTQPAAAATRCQEELASPNPDLGVLDEVADSTIQVTSLAAAQIVGDEGGEPPAPTPVSEPAAPVVKESRRTAEMAPPPAPPPPPPPPPTPEPVMTSPEAAPSGEQCPHCRHAMPTGRQVVFCPWCGQRLIPFACPKCHTELDSEWKHCITCGTPVKDPYRFV